MIGTPVGGDDKVGFELRSEGLDQHMHLLGLPRAALRVADDPTHRVACGYGREFLAGLQRDVAHALRRGVKLVKRALGKGVDLNGVDVAVLARFLGRGFVGGLHARGRRT